MSVDVLIVGAGPTGLILANQLARDGVNFRIVDSERGQTDLSKAIGVQARTLEMLDILGIAERLTSAGNPVKTFNLYDGDKRLLQLGFDGIDSRFPYLLIVPQSDTERVLIQRLIEQGGHIERSTRVTSVVQSASGITAKLTLEDQSEESVDARWLVGCDGAHSTVRKALNLPFIGDEYPEGFLLADVAAEGDLASDELYLFLFNGWLTAFFPLPGGRCRMIADLPPTHSTIDAAPSLAECQRIVDERVPQKILLSDAHWTSYYRIHRRMVPKLREGNVFLAGDAAHIHSPAAAQGMNTGMQDAFNLGWKLALAARGAGSNALLDSYNAERYPVERGVLAMTDALLKMVTLRQPAGRALRDTLLPVMSNTKLFQDTVAKRISQTGIDYRDSPISVNMDSHAHPRAGERVPDNSFAAGEGGATRIYERLRSGKSLLLVFPDPSAPSGQAMADTARAALGSAMEIVDVQVVNDTATRSSLGATHACVVLIRPDGYIGVRADAAGADQAIRRWSRAVFG